MTFKKFIDQNILSQHRLTEHTFIETTAFGDIWKVKLENKQWAALKIYGPRGMRNEAGGFAFLDSRKGKGCANIFYWDDSIALLEWLEGPSLGDISRDGDDERANQELVAVANEIHGQCPAVDHDLPKLDLWFEGFFELRFAPSARAQDVKSMQTAQALAQMAIAEQTNIMPLHGDLHHENIRLGARGYCAFDAKGVLAEKSFELANAFRNPRHHRNVVFDPGRVGYLSEIWSEEFDVDRSKLLRWAAVRCALSISWQCKERTFETHEEMELLEVLLAAARR